MLDSLQSTGKVNEKEKIKIAVRNRIIDPTNENVVAELIPKMKEWFGKTFVDETTTSWRSCIYLKRKPEEKVGDFILKYETMECNLKSSGINLSSLNLAIHLLETVNLSENQKRNIVSKVKFEDNDEVYDDVKKAIKLLEGSLVTNE